MRGKMAVIAYNGDTTYRVCSEPPPYEVLKELIDGYIELVPGFNKFQDEHCIAYCNEEGKLLGLQRNDMATKLWLQQHSTKDYFRGNVIILYGDDDFMEAL